MVYLHTYYTSALLASGVLKYWDCAYSIAEHARISRKGSCNSISRAGARIGVAGAAVVGVYLKSTSHEH